MRTAVAVAVLLAAICGRSEARDAHPHYRQATADLRVAYALIQCGPPSDPDGSRQDDAAREILATLDDWHSAGVDDGGDLSDHPRIDPPSSYSEALRRAVEMLQQARAKLQQAVDDKGAKGLQQRSLTHVDLALNATEQALSDFVEDP